jgi:hypothetical protein
MKNSAVFSFDDLTRPEESREQPFRAVRVVRKGKLAVAEPIESSEPLTDEAVRQTLMELRAERGRA